MEQDFVKQTLLQEKFPVLSIEIDRTETSRHSVDEIIDYFKAQIEAHKSARFIAVFDHYAHTKSLPDGSVSEDILAAKNVIFCFGIALPDPHALGLRPRSIGVAETTEGFLITFLEAPMPIANAAMEDWSKGLKDLPNH